MLISMVAASSVFFRTTAFHSPPGLPPAAKCQRHSDRPDDARHAAWSLVPTVQPASGAMCVAVVIAGMCIAIDTAAPVGAMIRTSYASPAGAVIVNVLAARPAGTSKRNSFRPGVPGAGCSRPARRRAARSWHRASGRTPHPRTPRCLAVPGLAALVAATTTVTTIASATKTLPTPAIYVPAPPLGPCHCRRDRAPALTPGCCVLRKQR